MSAHLQYNSFVEPDMLQLNMETISKELNDLIEMEKASVCENSNNACKGYFNKIKLPQVNETQVQKELSQVQHPQMIPNTYGLSQNLQSYGVYPNYYQAMAMPNLQYNSVNQPYGYYYMPVDFSPSEESACLNNANMHCHTNTGNFARAPEYEIHYLNAAPEYSGSRAVVPLISANIKEHKNRGNCNNGYRKYSKQQIYTLPTTEIIDYDNIHVDITELGWSLTG